MKKKTEPQTLGASLSCNTNENLQKGSFKTNKKLYSQQRNTAVLVSTTAVLVSTLIKEVTKQSLSLINYSIILHIAGAVTKTYRI